MRIESRHLTYVWYSYFEQNRINWLHLRFSFTIMSVLGDSFRVFFIIWHQNSQLPVRTDYSSVLWPSINSVYKIVSSCPSLPTLSSVNVLWCMLLFYLFFFFHFVINLSSPCNGWGQVCDESPVTLAPDALWPLIIS